LSRAGILTKLVAGAFACEHAQGASDVFVLWLWAWAE
jgi:hypothetical protein